HHGIQLQGRPTETPAQLGVGRPCQLQWFVMPSLLARSKQVCTSKEVISEAQARDHAPRHPVNHAFSSSPARLPVQSGVTHDCPWTRELP
ncbi:MAG: hypothetical protein AAFU79_06025, partial [Myxococcota bacterium]